MTSIEHVLLWFSLLSSVSGFQGPKREIGQKSIMTRSSSKLNSEDVLDTRPVQASTLKQLSPGYGVEERSLPQVSSLKDITVRQNLEMVYEDLMDWDRQARSLFSITLADVDVVTTKTNMKQLTASQKSGNRKEQRMIKSKTTTKTETKIRSKVIRTGKKPVHDRMEKVGSDVIPIWMNVAHTNDIPRKNAKKVTIGGIPLVVWRDAAGRLSALSDVCIHRGASLAKGWVSESGCIACPYHGFEFKSDGALVRTPGVVGACEGGEAPSSEWNSSPPTTVSYPVREAGGWIQVFPRASADAFASMHAPEMVLEPLEYPELLPEKFRAIEGGVDINGSVDAVMENVLDLLHISYVHLFGNAQEPLPITTEFYTSYDDPHPNQRNLKSGKVVFTYNAGSRAWSKVVGGAKVVRVENEFHLPYTAIIRVHFGKSTKTIVASATPVEPMKTRLNYKLYRNFAVTHPKDEGPINKVLDKIFLVLMGVTLDEDKEIVESLYEHARVGFMNGKYDRHQLSYRRAVQDFKDKIAEREVRIREGLFDQVAVPDFVGEEQLWHQDSGSH